MQRIARSWRLMTQSYGILKQDRELMLLPLISLVVTGLVAGSFLLGMFGLGVVDLDELGADGESPGLLGFLVYVLCYTIGIFFQAAVVAGATERMRGGDPTVSSSIAAAWQRMPAIVLWGLFAGTVGMVIRAIQERSEWMGRIVAGLIGAVWSLAIFYMVPVLVLEREGVRPSFDRSWTLFRRTWGETVAGNVGFGLLGLLLGLPIVLLAVLLAQVTSIWIAAFVAALGIGMLGLFLSTLQGIWVASLYRYATEGEVPPGYDDSLVESAFSER